MHPKFCQLTGLLALCLVTGCSKTGQNQETLNSETSLYENRADRSRAAITVVDEIGQPVQAKILIGEKLNSPFQNNWLATAADGALVLPAEWTSPQTVTIVATGHVRLTYLNQKPEGFEVRPRKTNDQLGHELTGMTTGYPVKDNDDQVDFGIAFPAVSKTDLLTFSPDLVISPVIEKISIVGKSVEFPSNVALPKQKERYFVSITLDKPKYRMYFRNPGEQKVFMARGRFPFTQVVDAFQDKQELFDLVNLLTVSGGQVQTVDVQGPSTTMDMNASEMTFTTKTSFQAPAMPATQSMLVVSAGDLGDSYPPADMKRLDSGQKAELNTFSDQPVSLLGVLKNKSEFSPKKPGADRFSAHLNHGPNGQTTFLPLITNPTVVNALSYRFDVPKEDQLKPLATSVMLSTLSWKGSGKDAKATATQRWEVRSNGWIGDLALPEIPGARDLFDFGGGSAKATPAQRVEVSFVASPTPVEAQSWNDVLSAVTHITHASQDY